MRGRTGGRIRAESGKAIGARRVRDASPCLRHARSGPFDGHAHPAVGTGQGDETPRARPTLHIDASIADDGAPDDERIGGTSWRR